MFHDFDRVPSPDDCQYRPTDEVQIFLNPMKLLTNVFRSLEQYTPAAALFPKPGKSGRGIGR